MNDFTKEELQMIVEFYSKLKDKTQRLIDNYCEHESVSIDYDEHALRCKKCLEIVNDNQ